MARVLVCGGRDYNDHARMTAVLDTYHAKIGIDVLIEGEQRGADLMARSWAEAVGVAVDPYEADWDNQGAFAGPIRNRRMLTEGNPDLVIAFPGDRGTANMMKQARKAGVEVIEVA